MQAQAAGHPAKRPGLLGYCQICPTIAFVIVCHCEERSDVAIPFPHPTGFNAMLHCAYFDTRKTPPHTSSYQPVSSRARPHYQQSGAPVSAPKVYQQSANNLSACHRVSGDFLIPRARQTAFLRSANHVLAFIVPPLAARQLVRKLDAVAIWVPDVNPNGVSVVRHPIDLDALTRRSL